MSWYQATELNCKIISTTQMKTCTNYMSNSVLKYYSFQQNSGDTGGTYPFDRNIQYNPADMNTVLSQDHNWHRFYTDIFYHKMLHRNLEDILQNTKNQNQVTCLWHVFGKSALYEHCCDMLETRFA